jgi:hypothetical protein
LSKAVLLLVIELQHGTEEPAASEPPVVAVPLPLMLTLGSGSTLRREASTSTGGGYPSIPTPRWFSSACVPETGSGAPRSSGEPATGPWQDMCR